MRVLAVLVGLAIVLLSGAGWLSHRFLNTPIGGLEVRNVSVERGATLRQVLHELSGQGAIRHPNLIYVYARVNKITEIRAGEYELKATMSPKEVVQTLHSGKVRLETITIAEGLNRWQIRDLLKTQGWMTSAEFDGLCDSATFLSEQNIPGPTCEGYLFPETYSFARGVQPVSIFQKMFAMYHQEIDGVVNADGTYGPMNLSEKQFATLASIVEKETAAVSERPHIACVFYNRLQAKPMWRLETDPTVAYAATLADPKFDGNLKRSHLRGLDSPYNTYRNYGLPAGPIASPGRGALEAVTKPENCKDYFFVSMNNGRHVFCPTLKCHNEAVQKWQIDYFKRPE